MSIEETLDGARVREVVIGSSQAAFHPMEAGVNCNARAIHTMIDLRKVILENLDGCIDLLIPLAQRVELLEGSGNDTANMAERLTVLCEPQREAEISIAKDR